MTVREILKQPSAFVPVVMSVAAMGTIVAQLVFVGSAPQPDEGTAAHLFQLLIGMQLPIVLYFAIKWLGRAARPAGIVLLIQFAAALLALAPIYHFGW